MLKDAMEPINFCYWLQGYFELTNPTNLNIRQIEEIKNHLNLVFHKETPKNIYPYKSLCGEIDSTKLINGEEHKKDIWGWYNQNREYVNPFVGTYTPYSC